MNNFDDYIPDIGYFIYRKCFPGWEIEKSVIDFHDLTYIIAGTGTYYIDETEMTVSAGDVLYITPGRIREAKSSVDEPMEMFAINFKLIPYREADNNSRLPFQLQNPIGYDPRLVFLCRQLTRVWIEKKDLYIIEARAAAMQIISELIRRVYQNMPVTAFDARVEKVKNYIHENFNDPLTLKQLAKIAELNDVYLGTLFKKTEGITINSYINKIRVNHATDIMLSEKVSVSEVAYRCGFQDAFYFCRVFKKYKGYPPSEVGKHPFYQNV